MQSVVPADCNADTCIPGLRNPQFAFCPILIPASDVRGRKHREGQKKSLSPPPFYCVPFLGGHHYDQTEDFSKERITLPIWFSFTM